MRIAVWRYATVGGMLLIAAFFAAPAAVLQDGIYAFVGFGSVACMVAGVRMYGAADPRAWCYLAASTLCFLAGDGVYAYDDLVRHSSPPFPSIADVPYLMGYPLLVVAVIRMTQGGRHVGVRENRTDGAIVTVGALALLWQLLMGSYAHDANMSPFGRLVTMAYPIMDVGVLFIVVSALLFSSTRRLSDTLIAVAMGSMLIGDLGYDVLPLHRLYQSGNAIDAG